MRKRIISMAMVVLLATSLAWAAPDPHSGSHAGRQDGLMYGKISPQPLTVKLSSQQVYVGESIWLTISGGVEPYVLIAAENRIQVVSRGKNTYQVSGVTAGESGLTIGDSKNNTVTKVITVLPKR
jgi:hypothetical protein